MTPEYDRVASEINKICSADCWNNPKTDCPYYDICADHALTKNPDEYARTAAFENALVARYKALAVSKTAEA